MDGPGPRAVGAQGKAESPAAWEILNMLTQPSVVPSQNQNIQNWRRPQRFFGFAQHHPIPGSWFVYEFHKVKRKKSWEVLAGHLFAVVNLVQGAHTCTGGEM